MTALIFTPSSFIFARSNNDPILLTLEPHLSVKSPSLSLKIPMNVPINNLWITSLLFDLCCEFINGSFAFSHG